LAACDISELTGIVFSGLSSLIIDDVTDQDGVIVVQARTAGGPVPCPRCGARTGHVHGYYERTVADVPADGRPVVVRVRVRRMRCPLPVLQSGFVIFPVSRVGHVGDAWSCDW
jgi:hypothetical protein